MISRRPGPLPLLLLLGLAIRILLVRYDGMMDVDVYREWGTSTYEKGLAEAFQGIYFPAQYQLFSLIAAVSAALGGSFVLWFKLVNLAFDCALMGVLWRWAGEPRKQAYVCFMYWLNPWFIALFSLGYCDFQFGFFIVLFLFLFKEDNGSRRSLVAGIPLGIAFLMKPQAMVVVMMMAFVGVFLLSRDRKALRPLVLAIVPAVMLFAGYSVWFAAHGKGITMLARTYLRTSAVMPSLTANMLNVWHPLCAFLHPEGSIWSMRDDVHLWPRITFRRVALAVTLLLQIWYAGTAVLRRPKGYELASAITFATLVVPLVMSGAHENHLYLGTVGMVVLLASGRLPRFGLALFAMFSILSTLNLVGYYGLGNNPLSDYAIIAAIKSAWTHSSVHLVAATVMIATFLAAIALFFSDAAGDQKLCRSWLSRTPVIATLTFLIAVYVTAALDAARLRAAPRLGNRFEPSADREQSVLT